MREKFINSLKSIKNSWINNPRLVNVFTLDNEEDIELAILGAFINGILAI